MFIKVTNINGDEIIVNADKIEEVVVTGDNELQLCYEEEYHTYIKGNLDEFYQRLINADRKDQH